MNHNIRFVVYNIIFMSIIIILCAMRLEVLQRRIDSNNNAAFLCIKHVANYELIWYPKTHAVTCEKDFDLPK